MSEEAKREANKFSSFLAAGDWGSPPLRSSLRRREGGGTLDLPVWLVNSRSRCWGGAVLMVAAAAVPISLPELQPHLGVAGCDVEELAGGLFLGAVGGTVAVAAFRILVLPLLPRLGGGGSVAIEGLWRLVFGVLEQLVSRSGPLRAGRSGGDLHDADFGLVSHWLDEVNSGGLDDGRAVSSLLAGRGGEGGGRDGATGVGLIWWGSVEDWLCFRLLLFLEMATPCSWWLGEVSPPTIDQRFIFRPSGRMILAVIQRSESAIEPRLHVGVWMLFLPLLRRCSGGVGGEMWQLLWWSSWRTFRGFFVFVLFVRVLSALFPGQVAFGFFLGCGCVFVILACTPFIC